MPALQPPSPARRYFAQVLRAAADRHCPGRLVALHEGGYSELYGARQQPGVPGWRGDGSTWGLGGGKGQELAGVSAADALAPCLAWAASLLGVQRPESVRATPAPTARIHPSPPVPFCGLEFIEGLAGLDSGTPDPMAGDVHNWGCQELQPWQDAAVAAAEAGPLAALRAALARNGGGCDEAATS